MTPMALQPQSHTVILMSPVVIVDYARLLEAALEYMPHPDENSLEGGPRAAAIVEKVAHNLAEQFLKAPVLTIGPNLEILVGTQEEATPP